MAFLKGETEQRACTIVYATHILDNLAQWPSHLVHMHLGGIKQWGPARDFLHERAGSESNHLGDLVLEWLKTDFADRAPRAKLHG